MSRKARDRERKRNVQLEAYDAYGGRFCKCCGENNYDFLQLDHIEGDGKKHRHMKGGATLAYFLKRKGWPPGFQVLCCNCNFAKRQGTTCPHTSEGLGTKALRRNAVDRDYVSLLLSRAVKPSEESQ